MQIVLVHGWSVTNTDTYGELPQWLAQQAERAQVSHVYLGRYVSFVDTLTLDDVARALQQALQDALGADMSQGFACITHSTGGPVVRLWMHLYHRGNLAQCPLKHLVMLAPANHGSALAQLGKGVLGRLKSLTEGVEPGVGILDWLELGSAQSWALNSEWLHYDCVAAGIYPFVLTGQTIDRSLYDHLNSYTGEPGSDGVVRAAAANMNYSLLRLHQDVRPGGDTLELDAMTRAPRTAFGILPGLAHSGEDIGIIRSVRLASAASHPTALWVRRCLAVRSKADYDKLCGDLDAVTEQTQQDERLEVEQKLFGKKKYITSRYTMLVLRFIDDRGNILNDYDLYITGGPEYRRDDLPPGFFVDRQRNRRDAGKLSYFLDYDVLRRGLSRKTMQGRIGFEVVARPRQESGALAYYRPLHFRSDRGALSRILKPNQTLMVEISLARRVDTAAFRITGDLKPGPFGSQPSGKEVG